VLHLVLQVNERELAHALQVILAKGVLVHDHDLNRLSPLDYLESKALVPDRLKGALFEVSLDTLVLNLEDHVRIRGSVHVHGFQIARLYHVDCQDAAMHDAELVELLCALYVPQLLAHVVPLALVVCYLLESFVQLVC